MTVHEYGEPPPLAWAGVTALRATMLRLTKSARRRGLTFFPPTLIEPSPIEPASRQDKRMLVLDHPDGSLRFLLIHAQDHPDSRVE